MTTYSFVDISHYVFQYFLFHVILRANTILYLHFLYLYFHWNNVGTVIVRVNEGLLNGDYVNVSINLDILDQNLTVNLGKYYSFKGIPYAEPPVGALRFKEPIPHKNWTGVRQAILHGPICVQYDIITNTYPPSSEDCLFLNVYTPTLDPEKLLSVIVFIHGGAWKSGSGNELLYGPSFIVQKNVILVTINYRLDALGFLNLGIKEVPGNAGLKDQRLALKWVYDKIRSFGGDHELVTLMGESAGSASVTYHMMSPMSKGLFRRAIAQSGVPFCEWALTYRLRDRSFALGKLLGNNTNDPTVMLEYLQSLPAIRLVNQFPIVRPEEINWNFGLKMTAFQPCPEEDFGQERFLVETAIETLKKGTISQVDLLIGYTSEEALILVPDIISKNLVQKYNDMRDLFIPREILLYGTPTNTTKLSDVIYEQYFGERAVDSSILSSDVNLVQYSDEIFVYYVNRFIKYLPSSFKMYVYKFSIVTLRNRFSVLGVPFNITGVSHTDDLVYIFDSRIPGVDILDITDTISKLINQTVTLITNFAKFGNPTPDASLGVIWPEYNSSSKAYMHINTTLTVKNDVDADVNAFWTDIHEDGGVELP